MLRTRVTSSRRESAGFGPGVALERRHVSLGAEQGPALAAEALAVRVVVPVGATNRHACRLVIYAGVTTLRSRTPSIYDSACQHGWRVSSGSAISCHHHTSCPLSLRRAKPGSRRPERGPRLPPVQDRTPEPCTTVSSGVSDSRVWVASGLQSGRTSKGQRSRGRHPVNPPTTRRFRSGRATGPHADRRTCSLPCARSSACERAEVGGAPIRRLGSRLTC